MLNAPVSLWVLAKNKPTGAPQYRTYLPVQHDTAWTLLLAGAIAGCIVMGCVGCALKNWEEEQQGQYTTDTIGLN